MLQNSTFNLKIICSLTVKHAFGLLCSHHIFSCLELLFAHWQCVILNILFCLLFVHLSCRNLLNVIKSSTCLFWKAIPRHSNRIIYLKTFELQNDWLVDSIRCSSVWSAFGSSKFYADSTSYSSVCSALKMHFWSFQAIRASQWQHKNLIKILFCLQNVCARTALC